MSPSTAKIFTVALTALSFLAQAQAQNLTSISQSCQTTVTGILASPIANCINVAGLLGVASASGSVITPLDGWIKGVCSTTCSPSDLSTAKTNVMSGCAADLQSGNPAAEAIYVLTANYTQVKDVLCLEAVSNSTFCLTDFLNNVQTSSGKTLDLNTVAGLISSNVQTLESLLGSLPNSQLCSDCNKAFVSKVTPFLPQSDVSQLDALATSKCGASFVDGSLPSTVKEASGTSGAGMLKVSSGLIAVAIVASLF